MLLILDRFFFTPDIAAERREVERGVRKQVCSVDLVRSTLSDHQRLLNLTLCAFNG